MSGVLVTCLLALLMGIVAGLRAMTAPAALSWAAYLGWLDVTGTWLAFLGRALARWVLTALTLLELVTDQLPSTPSRSRSSSGPASWPEPSPAPPSGRRGGRWWAVFSRAAWER